MSSAYLFPLLAVLIWAGNVVVSKLAVGTIFPAELAFYRWVLAWLVLTPVALPAVWRTAGAWRPHVGRLAVLGVLGMALYQSIAYFAAYHTTATNMGIILLLLPLMTMALAIPLLGEAVTRGAVSGALLSGAGIVLVIAHGDPRRLLHLDLGVGDAMMLVGTLAYALYSVLLRKWRLPLPALPSLYLQIMAALVVLLVPYLLLPKAGITAANLPLILFAGIPTSAIAPFLWMAGVQRLGPSRAALCANLLPLFTALIAAVTLGERLGWHHVVGAALTMAGVLLTERWKRPLLARAAIAG